MIQTLDRYSLNYAKNSYTHSTIIAQMQNIVSGMDIFKSLIYIKQIQISPNLNNLTNEQKFVYKSLMNLRQKYYTKVDPLTSYDLNNILISLLPNQEALVDRETGDLVEDAYINSSYYMVDDIMPSDSHDGVYPMYLDCASYHKSSIGTYISNYKTNIERYIIPLSGVDTLSEHRRKKLVTLTESCDIYTI
jgi:hypothetical protein